MEKKFQEIVINTKHGGFGLSHEATLLYGQLKGLNLHWYIDETSALIYLDLPYEHIKFDDRKKFTLTELKKEFTPKQVEKILRLMKSGHIHAHYEDDKGEYFSDYDLKRDDQDLITVVKKLKKKANGRFSNLKVVRIPLGVEWEREEYDGREWVAEKHRTWS